MELILGYLAVFIFLILVGVPIAFSLGVATMGIFLVSGEPAGLIPQRMWNGISGFPLVAIPLFILAGELMSTGGILARILDFARFFVGRFRGGLYHVNILISMVFGGLNGSAVADTSAVGSLLIKPTVDEYGDPDLAAAVTACSSVVGPIIPPSIPMLVYAFVGEVSVSEMFAAGIVPGILIGLGLMVVTHFIIIRKNYSPSKVTYETKDVVKIFLNFLLPFLLPVIMIGGIVSGIFTPTEAGCVATLYAVLVGFLVTRELTWDNCYKAAVRTVVLTAIVMIMVSIASVATNWLSRMQITSLVAGAFESVTSSTNGFWLLYIVFLLIIGLFLEQVAAIIMIVPVFLPIAGVYDISPLQFGLVTVVTLAMGLVTPPVGLCVYISSGIANRKVEGVFLHCVPYLLLMISVILMLALFPDIYLWVPRLLGFGGV